MSLVYFIFLFKKMSRICLKKYIYLFQVFIILIKIVVCTIYTFFDGFFFIDVKGTNYYLLVFFKRWKDIKKHLAMLTEDQRDLSSDQKFFLFFHSFSSILLTVLACWTYFETNSSKLLMISSSICSFQVVLLDYLVLNTIN